jgi:hypothetical protein
VLFQQRFLDGIRSGSVTLAFRRWRRPSVRSGGTLLTPIGQLGIASVAEVSLSDISAADARRAGYDSLESLRAALRERSEGRVYRIELGPLRADPRVALRQAAELTDHEHRDVPDGWHGWTNVPASRGRRACFSSSRRVLVCVPAISAASPGRRS